LAMALGSALVVFLFRYTRLFNKVWW
jgi:hypothetical protein